MGTLMKPPTQKVCLSTLYKSAHCWICKSTRLKIHHPVPLLLLGRIGLSSLTVSPGFIRIVRPRLRHRCCCVDDLQVIRLITSSHTQCHWFFISGHTDAAIHALHSVFCPNTLFFLWMIVNSSIYIVRCVKSERYDSLQIPRRLLSMSGVLCVFPSSSVFAPQFFEPTIRSRRYSILASFGHDHRRDYHSQNCQQ